MIKFHGLLTQNIESFKVLEKITKCEEIGLKDLNTVSKSVNCKKSILRIPEGPI